MEEQIIIVAALDQSPYSTKLMCFWEGGVVDEKFLLGKTFKVVSNPVRGQLMLQYLTTKENPINEIGKAESVAGEK